MLKNKKLYFNEKKEMSQAELFEMNEDDYYNILIEEQRKEPSDAEIINSYNNDIEAVINEMRAFHDRLLIEIQENNISIKNKFKFIMDVLESEDKSRVSNLIMCFICDKEYIFNLKEIMRKDTKNRNIAMFVVLKKDMDSFNGKLKIIRQFDDEFKDLKKVLLKHEEIIKGDKISFEHKNLLKYLFKEYVWEDIEDERFFDENLEHIHNFCTSNEERKSVYSCLMFRILIKYRTKLFNDSVMIGTKNLLNYNEYKIDNDNGKNFITNEKYIKLFFELCNGFCEDDNLELNLFMFEMCSNLGIWYWLQNRENTEFSYTYNSLFNIYTNKYDTFFDDVSVYFDDDYSNRGIQNEYEDNGKIKKKVITEDDYIDDIIHEKLKEIDDYGIKYLQCYKKGTRFALKYVEEIKDMLLEDECEELRKDSVFNRHVNFNIEGELQNWCDWWINGEIMKVLQQGNEECKL